MYFLRPSEYSDLLLRHFLISMLYQMKKRAVYAHYVNAFIIEVIILKLFSYNKSGEGFTFDSSTLLVFIK